MKLLTCPKCKRIFRKKIGLKLHAKFSHGKTLELLTRQIKRSRKMQKFYDISSSSDESDNNLKINPLFKKINKKSSLSYDSDDEIEVLQKNFHQVQKDNKCNYCKKSFFHSEGLKIHNILVHDSHRSYNCDICGKSCVCPGDLKKHFKNVHKDKKDQKNQRNIKSKFDLRYESDIDYDYAFDNDINKDEVIIQEGHKSVHEGQKITKKQRNSQSDSDNDIIVIKHKKEILSLDINLAKTLVRDDPEVWSPTVLLSDWLKD